MTDTLTQSPVGYRLEYRPGRPCFYSLDDFARETFAEGAEIRGLYTQPQSGCSDQPAAYRGRYWHEATHYEGNRYLDPEATPLYLGQVLHSPCR